MDTGKRGTYGASIEGGASAVSCRLSASYAGGRSLRKNGSLKKDRMLCEGGTEKGKKRKGKGGGRERRSIVKDTYTPHYYSGSILRGHLEAAWRGRRVCVE